MEIRPSATLSVRRSTLLLLGAFAFAFCVGTTAHELGHYVVDQLVGITDLRMILHPFASPRIVVPGGFPDALRGWPDAAGPLANIAVSSVVALLLWRRRRPAILPLLLWAPMAYVQEGFSAAVGLALDGSDSAWLVRVGVPLLVVLVASVLLIGAGLVGMWLLFPLLGIEPDHAAGSKFAILAGGMGSYMTILSLYNVVVSPLNPAEFQRGIVLLAFVLLLATLLATMHRPLHPFLQRIAGTDLARTTVPAVVTVVSMGSAVVILELLLFNA